VIHVMLRHPTHMISVMQLAGGRQATLRPALPQDAELQRAFFRALSDEDRYYRFMSRMAEPTDALVQRFTDIDHRSHVALLACATADSRETMVGEVRYIADEVDPASAEFAVAVTSGWQGMGLGRMLLARLTSHAVAAGMSRLEGDTLANNAGMIALARNSGFTVAPKREDRRLMRLVKDLTAGSGRARSAGQPSTHCATAA